MRLPLEKRMRLFRRDGHKCVRCGSKRELTVDHVIPIALGGSKTSLSNMQTLCNFCNTQKDNTIACYATHRDVREYVLDFNRRMKNNGGISTRIPTNECT